MDKGIASGVTKTVALCLLVGLGMACSSSSGLDAAPGASSAGRWDLDRAEVLRWIADDSGFDQDNAVEASGLAASGRFLYATSEKYAALLQIDPQRRHAARVLRLAVPPLSELEGVAFAADRLFLCDEAHAAVYMVELEDEATAATRPDDPLLAVVILQLDGIDVAPGKIGLEGLAVTADGNRLFVLLERSKINDGACVSTIFAARLDGERLVAEGEPLVIRLEDCNWRLTGLVLDDDRLLALKTQYPGERYQLIEIDPINGRWRVVLDLTEYARAIEREGYGNNLEGLALTANGDLYLISDNAETGITDDPYPPPAKERTLFVRLPGTGR